MGDASQTNLLRSSVSTEILRIETFRNFMSQQFAEAIQKSDPSLRGLIFFASLHKLRAQAQAVLLLAPGAFVEEITAIARTMAEVVINAAYLQFAEDGELERFQHFDTQSLYRSAEQLRPLTSNSLTDEERFKLDSVVREARDLTGLDDKANSWSRRSGLIHRAEYVEKNLTDTFMVALVRTTFAWGHRSVHGTSDALAPFYESLGTGSVPRTSQREESLVIALGAVSFPLYVFAMFMDRFLGQNRQNEIVKVGRMVAD